MSAKRAERLQVMLTIDEVRRVEEWRYQNRMPSRSAAVRALMNLGLRAHAVLDQAALLEGAVSSPDVGVVENGLIVDSDAERAAILAVAVDGLVGQGLARLLDRAGFRVVGPARGPAEARAFASHDNVAAALLDGGAGSEVVNKVADQLAGQGIPFVIIAEASGNAPSAPGAAEVVDRSSAETALARIVKELLA